MLTHWQPVKVAAEGTCDVVVLVLPFSPLRSSTPTGQRTQMVEAVVSHFPDVVCKTQSAVCQNLEINYFVGRPDIDTTKNNLPRIDLRRLRCSAQPDELRLVSI